MPGLSLFSKNRYYIGGVLVVSLFTVSVFITVSALGGVVVAAAESTLALSVLLLAAFSELQPVAIDPIIAATRAKLKICFFIGFLSFLCANLCNYNFNY